MSPQADIELAKTAIQHAHQPQKLSHQKPQDGSLDEVAAQATVISTAQGHRLPTVPLEEAHELNSSMDDLVKAQWHDDVASEDRVVPLEATPPSHTNPLFPPLPLYGPPSLLRDAQCLFFRVTSFFLSLSFLNVLLLASMVSGLPSDLYSMYMRMTFRDPDADRPFYKEELRRRERRATSERQWKRRNSKSHVQQDTEHSGSIDDGFVPTEGGPDPIVCDVGYYARRVGLDVEEFEVQTEDGFILDLLHVYDPREHTPLPPQERRHHGPEVFTDARRKLGQGKMKPKYPILLLHGLLQSAGAFICNDDDSLAFWLCKSGYDVWLGNNRCGFNPRHAHFDCGDPRMWAWNIREMGVFDLPAMISRVLRETGFSKVGLVCHSQGSAQTFVALAKDQRPDLGDKLSVVCALAPAVYAGPLLDKTYLKFMRTIGPNMFRLIFGIHSFIPLMIFMLSNMNPRVYGWTGYKVFSFLFDWSDKYWDRGLRDRWFQFAPVYISTECIQWWLGQEGFAKHKCIMATREECHAEELEDLEVAKDDRVSLDADQDGERSALLSRSENTAQDLQQQHGRRPKGSTAWYNEKVPPFALWVGGKDYLVDGKRFLRRLERGREPHVKVVHAKVIEKYEHLVRTTPRMPPRLLGWDMLTLSEDLVCSLDAPSQVFNDMREVLWKTSGAQDLCRVPFGCEDVQPWTRETKASPPKAKQ